MSFTPTIFDFFDAVNDQVQTFGKVLDESGAADYEPYSQSAHGKHKKNRELQKANQANGWFNEWSVLPPTDLLDHEKNYELNVAIPGIKDKKHINLEYHKEANQIVVSGEIPSTITEENKHNVRVKELATGKFKRVITLPRTPGVDADNIRADYTNGVLRLNIPKLEPEQHGSVKKIELD